MGLLEQVARQRAVGLPGLPRALGPQPAHHLEELEERLAGGRPSAQPQRWVAGSAAAYAGSGSLASSPPWRCSLTREGEAGVGRDRLAVLDRDAVARVDLGRRCRRARPGTPPAPAAVRVLVGVGSPPLVEDRLAGRLLDRGDVDRRALRRRSRLALRRRAASATARLGCVDGLVRTPRRRRRRTRRRTGRPRSAARALPATPPRRTPCGQTVPPLELAARARRRSRRSTSSTCQR